MKELLPQVAEVTLHYKTKIKPSQRPSIKSSEDVVSVLSNIEELQENIEYKELFYAIYLSQAGKVLSVMKISEGGLTSTIVDIRIIFQCALLVSATSMIIVHNHPSGNVTPSHQDISLTKEIQKAGDLMHIQLWDSIIISENKKFSFVEESMM